jgi:hypothetical protein
MQDMREQGGKENIWAKRENVTGESRELFIDELQNLCL